MKICEHSKKHYEERYKIDDMPWTHNKIPELVKDFASKLKKQSKHPKLLDLGCGDGWSVNFFAKNGIFVEAVDSSPTAIKKSKERLGNKKTRKNVNFTLGDAMTFPYSPNSFDAVFDSGFFHHQPKYMENQYLYGIDKVLKKGGLFYLKVFNDAANKANRKKLGKKRDWKIRNYPGIKHKVYDRFFNKRKIVKIFFKKFELLEEERDTDYPVERRKTFKLIFLKK